MPSLIDVMDKSLAWDYDKIHKTPVGGLKPGMFVAVQNSGGWLIPDPNFAEYDPSIEARADIEDVVVVEIERIEFDDGTLYLVPSNDDAIDLNQDEGWRIEVFFAPRYERLLLPSRFSARRVFTIDRDDMLGVHTAASLVRQQQVEIEALRNSLELLDGQRQIIRSAQEMIEDAVHTMDAILENVS